MLSQRFVIVRLVFLQLSSYKRYLEYLLCLICKCSSYFSVFVFTFGAPKRGVSRVYVLFHHSHRYLKLFMPETNMSIVKLNLVQMFCVVTGKGRKV